MDDRGPLDLLRAIMSPASPLTTAERTILTALVLHRHNATGECRQVGQPRLAACAGLSDRRAVRRVLQRLEARGWLTRIQTPGRLPAYQLRIPEDLPWRTPTRDPGSRGDSRSRGDPASPEGGPTVPGTRDPGSPDLPILPISASSPPEGAAAPPARRGGRPRRSRDPQEPDPLAAAAQDLVARLDRLLRDHGVPGGVPSGPPWARQVRIARQQLAECGHPAESAAAALEWSFGHGSDWLRRRLTGSGRMLALGDALGEWLHRDAPSRANGQRYQDPTADGPRYSAAWLAGAHPRRQRGFVDEEDAAETPPTDHQAG